jgi:hypothetical protein
MAVVKRKKKKIGTVGYVVFLLIWILLLAYATYYVLQALGRFEEYYEAAEINPVIEAFMEEHKDSLVNQGLADKIRTIEHPFQTEEECLQYVQEGFKDELHYVRTSGAQSDYQAVYSILCGEKEIGKVTLEQTPFVPDDIEIIQKYVKEWNLYPWKVVDDNFEFDIEQLSHAIRVTVPEEYTVLINGHPLTEEFIVERGIHYDMLEEYYKIAPELPTKCTYEVNGLFGNVELSYQDEMDQNTEYDPEQDDSQFLQPVSGQMYDRMYTFAYQFSSRYLEFSAGTTDMQWLYDQLYGYIQKGSELDERLQKAMEGYAGWQHSSRFRFETATLHNVTPLPGDIYVLDVTASANCIQPIGNVRVERSFHIYVKYFTEDDDILAFSVEDY